MLRTPWIALATFLVLIAPPVEAGRIMFVDQETLVKRAPIIVEGTLEKVVFAGEARRERDQIGFNVTFNNIGNLYVKKVYKGDIQPGENYRVLVETEEFEYQGKGRGYKRYVNLANAEKEPEAGDHGLWYLKKAGKGYRVELFENPQSAISGLEANVEAEFTDEQGMVCNRDSLTYIMAEIELEEALDTLKKLRKRSKKKAKTVRMAREALQNLENELKKYFKSGHFGHPKRKPIPALNLYGPESIEDYRIRVMGKLLSRIRKEEKRLDVKGQILKEN